MVQIVDVYVFVLATTAVLSLGVAFAAWMQRAVSRAWPVVVLMLGVTAWCGSEAVVWSASSLVISASRPVEPATGSSHRVPHTRSADGLAGEGVGAESYNRTLVLKN